MQTHDSFLCSYNALGATEKQTKKTNKKHLGQKSIQNFTIHWGKYVLLPPILPMYSSYLLNVCTVHIWAGLWMDLMLQNFLPTNRAFCIRGGGGGGGFTPKGMFIMWHVTSYNTKISDATSTVPRCFWGSIKNVEKSLLDLTLTVSVQEKLTWMTVTKAVVPTLPSLPVPVRSMHISLLK